MPAGGRARRTIALRATHAADAELLYRVYASARAEELALVDWSKGQREAFLRMQFEAQDREYRARMPDASFQLVLVDGQAAGRLYVDRRESEIRIVDIALLPEFRGSGVGSELLAAILDEGTASGRRVTVHVERGNRARSLYQRLGFREVGGSGVYALLERSPG